MMKEKFIGRLRRGSGSARNFEAPRRPKEGEESAQNLALNLALSFVCDLVLNFTYNFRNIISKVEYKILGTLVSPFRASGGFKIASILTLLFFFSSCSAKIVTPSSTSAVSAVSAASSDSSAYQLVKTLSIEAQFITSDKLAQLYVVTNKNDLIKYNSKGEELFRYTNNTLGELKHVDVTNPFNILLYYPEFLTVLTLNRTLNQTGEFSLFDLNVVDVQAVAMSNDNNIWLYDDVSFQIKKIDRKGETLVSSENLSNQFSKVLQPNFILERDNWLYLNDTTLGVLIFDTYGQYAKLVDVKGLLSFQVLDDQLIYRKNDRLESFHLRSLNIMSIELPKDIFKEHEISIQRERLFVKKEKVIEIYKY